MSISDDEYDELEPDINLLIVLGIANDFFHDMMTEYLGYIDRMSSRTSSLTGRITLKEMNLLQDGKKVTVEEDQFYLVDSGYPNMPGFLALYRGRCYHLRDYQGQGRPRGKEELFNYRHSDFNYQEPIPIDSSQTAQMGNVRDEIASNMWNDYMEHLSSLQ
ncbi:hypothetical protein ZIOFF_029978 [Zingiber officinale]|uniref:DDE Tnp4 domain-containing protein n=1 Tax=Zingiber officinale TaxID=94328 RepID=A0A8J5GZB0_ZINOF|nr:hypothetical protein ZIOFF_029978 [Zingiber officinale]